jgi:hypothetical protein
MNIRKRTTASWLILAAFNFPINANISVAIFSDEWQRKPNVKIGHVHTHPVVMCVTLPNMGPGSLKWSLSDRNSFH